MPLGALEYIIKNSSHLLVKVSQEGLNLDLPNFIVKMKYNSKNKKQVGKKMRFYCQKYITAKNRIN